LGILDSWKGEPITVDSVLDRFRQKPSILVMLEKSIKKKILAKK
jgi:hypothetical protein